MFASSSWLACWLMSEADFIYLLTSLTPWLFCSLSIFFLHIPRVLPHLMKMCFQFYFSPFIFLSLLAPLMLCVTTINLTSKMAIFPINVSQCCFIFSIFGMQTRVKLFTNNLSIFKLLEASILLFKSCLSKYDSSCTNPQQNLIPTLLNLDYYTDKKKNKNRF